MDGARGKREARYQPLPRCPIEKSDRLPAHEERQIFHLCPPSNALLTSGEAIQSPSGAEPNSTYFCNLGFKRCAFALRTAKSSSALTRDGAVFRNHSIKKADRRMLMQIVDDLWDGKRAIICKYRPLRTADKRGHSTWDMTGGIQARVCTGVGRSNLPRGPSSRGMPRETTVAASASCVDASQIARRFSDFARQSASSVVCQASGVAC